MKRKCLIFLNRSEAELFWLNNVLKILKKKFKIYFILKKKLIISSLKKNKSLYKDFNTYNAGYLILNKNLIYYIYILNLKIIQKIRYLIKIEILEKFYNSYKLKFLKYFYLKNINLGINDIILSDYQTFNFQNDDLNFFNIINNLNNRPKIIRYPPSTFIFKKKLKNLIIGDYLLISDESNYNLFNFDKKKIFFFGNPQYDKLKKTPKKKFNTIVFAYSSVFNHYPQYKNLLIEQFKKIINILIKKKLKIIIKLHPRKKDKKIFKIIENFKYKNIKISNDNLINLSQKSDLLLSDLNSSAIFDFLACSKPCINYYDPTDKRTNALKQVLQDNNINIISKNSESLSKLIDRFYSNDILFKNQIKNYKKNLGHKNLGSIKKIEKFILNISYEKKN